MIDTDRPALSVIIPARNEFRFIDGCLRSVFAADPVAGGLEVLVVDGMSEDGTRELLADWGRRHANLRVLDNPSRIVPAAMNIGIRAARGRWIARIDAHAEYPADYFARCLAAAMNSEADNVGGGVETLCKDGTLQARLVQALTTHRFGVGNSGFRVGAREGEADTVVFGCYRREVFDRIGFYDERLARNQDYELNCRLRKAGGRVWFDPKIRARYFNQSSLRGLLGQAFGTGQWNPWMWSVAPYSLAWRHAIPLAFVTALLGTLLAAVFTPVLGLSLLALLLISYFAIACLAAAQQSLRYGAAVLPLLPAAFFLYHVAYGLGGLVGICRLGLGQAPVQRAREPWPGAGSAGSWPDPKQVS